MEIEEEEDEEEGCFGQIPSAIRIRPDPKDVTLALELERQWQD